MRRGSLDSCDVVGFTARGAVRLVAQPAVHVTIFATVLLGTAAAAADDRPAAGWKAAAAAVTITPADPLPMAGYAGRTEPAEGTEQELFAKALAIEDAAGGRVVLITLDLIGVSAELRSQVVAGLGAARAIPAHAILLNASHTHCGPDYRHEAATAYRESLTRGIVAAATEAIDRLAPAELTYGTARASVSMNRRTPSPQGYLNHPNPQGPVDQSVPTLAVRTADGGLAAVLFGYACHNTTMGFRRWLGDYAGYAQEDLEEDHPGTKALFMMGCGGDQNPYPRGELKYAQRHGRTLATAVEAALEVNQKEPRHQRRISGTIRSALGTVDLPFTDPARPPLAYPVQAIRLGDGVLIVALGMEATVDYALRLKEELSKPDGPAVWIAGYSNLYPGYVPSRRVLLEGGYEAQSMPWDPGLEERIVSRVHDVVAEVGGSGPAAVR
jgi:neutral ceramidase